MVSDDRVRVVTWLHLEDREEYGDEYEDGSPISWTREVWKSVSIGPWTYGPDSLSRSVPLTVEEAKKLLHLSSSSFEDAVYAKLNVTSRRELHGLPKGPYFDPINISHIRKELKKAIRTAGEGQNYSGLDRRGEIHRRDAALSLRETIVEKERKKWPGKKEGERKRFGACPLFPRVLPGTIVIAHLHWKKRVILKKR